MIANVKEINNKYNNKRKRFPSFFFFLFPTLFFLLVKLTVQSLLLTVVLTFLEIMKTTENLSFVMWAINKYFMNIIVRHLLSQLRGSQYLSWDSERELVEARCKISDILVKLFEFHTKTQNTDNSCVLYRSANRICENMK